MEQFRIVRSSWNGHAKMMFECWYFVDNDDSFLGLQLTKVEEEERHRHYYRSDPFLSGLLLTRKQSSFGIEYTFQGQKWWPLENGRKGGRIAWMISSTGGKEGNCEKQVAVLLFFVSCSELPLLLSWNDSYHLQSFIDHWKRKDSKGSSNLFTLNFEMKLGQVAGIYYAENSKF